MLRKDLGPAPSDEKSGWNVNEVMEHARAKGPKSTN